MTRALLLVLALSGCGEDAASSAVCDADCRVQTAVAAWGRSVGEGSAAMEAITDPTERLLVARTVMENGHIEGGEVCRFVENPSTHEYCMRLSHRPHLFEAPRQQAARRERAAGGPVDSELLPARPLVTSAADVPAAELVGCRDGESTTACADRLAMDAARRGQPAEIAGLCNAVTALRLRSECRFAAAEEAVRVGGAAAVAAAVPLCIAAGDYVAHCLGHSVTRLAERSPPADAPRGAWSEVIAGAEALEASLRPLDAALARSAADRVYAEAAALAYARAGTLGGHPLDALPERAVPVVRASLAWELVKRGSLMQTRDLTTAVEALASAESSRAEPGAPVEEPARVVVRNRWGADDRESSGYAASWWRGTARRPTDPSPDTDRALCVLEAVADIRGQQDPMLSAAVTHESRVVAWSAARLSGRPGSLPPAPREDR